MLLIIITIITYTVSYFIPLLVFSIGFTWHFIIGCYVHPKNKRSKRSEHFWLPKFVYKVVFILWLYAECQFEIHSQISKVNNCKPLLLIPRMCCIPKANANIDVCVKWILNLKYLWNSAVPKLFWIEISCWKFVVLNIVLFLQIWSHVLQSSSWFVFRNFLNLWSFMGKFMTIAHENNKLKLWAFEFYM